MSSHDRPPAALPAAHVQVRSATPSDVPSIMELIRGLAEYERLSDGLSDDEDSLREHLFGRRRYAETLIAERDGRAVGYALFFHTYSTFLLKPGIWLEDIFVTPECRRLGVGVALLARVAAIALERGCGRLEWSVLDWNEPALGFYRALGARPVSGWTEYRLTGDALERLATSAADARDM